MGVCVLCGGRGCVETHERTETALMVSESFATHLCECRKRLPPRLGVARWWGTETALRESVAGLIPETSVDVVVAPEVPISEDNYRVLRTADNQYWPTLVDVSIADERVTLTPEGARKLAAVLTRAADLSERLDVPESPQAENAVARAVE